MSTNHLYHTHTHTHTHSIQYRESVYTTHMYMYEQINRALNSLIILQFILIVITVAMYQYLVLPCKGRDTDNNKRRREDRTARGRPNREGEREGERETERETKRQTDRQTETESK